MKKEATRSSAARKPATAKPSTAAATRTPSRPAPVAARTARPAPTATATEKKAAALTASLLKLPKPAEMREPAAKAASSPRAPARPVRQAAQAAVAAMRKPAPDERVALAPMLARLDGRLEEIAREFDRAKDGFGEASNARSASLTDRHVQKDLTELATEMRLLTARRAEVLWMRQALLGPETPTR